MGTAPTEQQLLVPVDAEQFIAQAVVVLEDTGIPHHRALAMMAESCLRLAGTPGIDALVDVSELRQVAKAVLMRAESLAPSPTDRRANDNADGTGSRAGSTTPADDR